MCLKKEIISSFFVFILISFYLSFYPHLCFSGRTFFDNPKCPIGRNVFVALSNIKDGVFCEIECIRSPVKHLRCSFFAKVGSVSIFWQNTPFYMFNRFLKTLMARYINPNLDAKGKNRIQREVF